MKKYKTAGNWRAAIEVVECERETDSCVWIRGGYRNEARRQNKRSSYESYFDTFQEAKDYLIGLGEGKVVSARRQLEEANIVLQNNMLEACISIIRHHYEEFTYENERIRIGGKWYYAFDAAMGGSGKSLISDPPSSDGLRDDLDQLIRVCLTSPSDIRGFIHANYPKEYETMNMASVISGDEPKGDDVRWQVENMSEKTTVTHSPSETQAEASPANPSEILVDDDLEELDQFLEAMRDGAYCVTESVMTRAAEHLHELRAYLAKPEPVTVSLESIARVINEMCNKKWNAYMIGKDESFEIAKAVLDAAGVKYVD